MPPKEKYDPNFHPESYIELSKQGKTKAQICSKWQISRDTLHRWSKTKKTLSDAIKIGKEHREAWWTELGMSLIVTKAETTTTKTTGKTKTTTKNVKKITPAMYIFLAKNVLDWSDKTEIIEGQRPGFKFKNK